MKKKFKHTLIVIVGPTAVGKTSMAIQLAKMFKTEIISADSRQFYKELEIGTAKPTSQELNEVPHHLINSHSFTDLVDAGSYERVALEKVKDVFKNHENAIVVGGSGLYIQSLCDGLDPVDIRDDELRSELSLKSLQELQAQLQLLDPEYFAEVDVQNP